MRPPLWVQEGYQKRPENVSKQMPFHTESPKGIRIVLEQHQTRELHKLLEWNLLLTFSTSSLPPTSPHAQFCFPAAILTLLTLFFHHSPGLVRLVFLPAPSFAGSLLFLAPTPPHVVRTLQGRPSPKGVRIDTPKSTRLKKVSEKNQKVPTMPNKYQNSVGAKTGDTHCL